MGKLERGEKRIIELAERLVGVEGEREALRVSLTETYCALCRYLQSIQHGNGEVSSGNLRGGSAEISKVLQAARLVNDRVSICDHDWWYICNKFRVQRAHRTIHIKASCAHMRAHARRHWHTREVMGATQSNWCQCLATLKGRNCVRWRAQAPHGWCVHEKPNLTVDRASVGNTSEKPRPCCTLFGCTQRLVWPLVVEMTCAPAHL